MFTSDIDGDFPNPFFDSAAFAAHERRQIIQNEVVFEANEGDVA